MSMAEAKAAQTEEIEREETNSEATAFRNMVKQVSGRNISSIQATQFLGLFEQDLQSELTNTRRLFIEKHFGKK